MWNVLQISRFIIIFYENKNARSDGLNVRYACLGKTKWRCLCYDAVLWNTRYGVLLFVGLVLRNITF